MQAFQKDRFSQTRNDVQVINALAAEGPARIIELGDRRFQKHVQAVARQILQNDARLVLLAGPSSSGKTTTAHMLAQALTGLGHPAQIISTDDFFLGAARAPRRPDGTPDLECPQAMNLAALQQCLRDLVTAGGCDTPVFDFARQVSVPHGRTVRLAENGVAVVEGIHALNPLLTKLVPDESRIMRVFLSVQQEVRNGAEVLLKPAQVRLIRRIVRDYNFRSTSPVQTLRMWPSVMEGELMYISPWRKHADAAINSLHAYEFGVLRAYALPLLQTAEDADSAICREAQDLSFALMLFTPIPPAFVPQASLIREFIGKV